MSKSIEYNTMKEGNTTSAGRVDIRNEKCPYTFIRAKLALEEIEVGGVLEIHLDNITALKSLPKAFLYQGQEYLGTEKIAEGEWIIRIRRLK
ncbi:MAG: sulfurtransferase TusA family protein [Myxococcota bacterium]